MVKILPRRPEWCARQHIKIAPGQPFGPARPRQGNHPLQDTGKGADLRGAGGAYGNRSRDIGRAVAVLSTAIHQQQRVRQNFAVGLFGHTVMHDGPIGPSAADRVKTDIVERPGGLAKAL